MLTQEQKNLVRMWIAAGLKDREIIRMAKESVPPFHLSQQNISKNYRKQVREQAVRIERKQAEKIRAALPEKYEVPIKAGLEMREERVRRLEKCFEDLAEMFADSKAVHDRKGSVSIMAQMRGCLDDIAKELGDRQTKVDVNANVRVRDIIAIRDRVYGKHDS